MEEHKEMILEVIDKLQASSPENQAAVRYAIEDLRIAYLTDNPLLEKISIINAMRYLSVLA